MYYDGEKISIILSYCNLQDTFQKCYEKKKVENIVCYDFHLDLFLLFFRKKKMTFMKCQVLFSLRKKKY